MDALRAGAGVFRRNTDDLTALETPDFPGLRSAIAALSLDRPISAPTRESVEECIRSWHAGGPLERRAVRILCWEPSVALEPEFHFAIERQGIVLRAQAIQGLVRSCHMKWASYLADDTLQRIALKALKSYQGANRTVRRWQENSLLILGPDGPAKVGKWMLDERKPPREAASSGRLDESTEFFVAAMSSVTATTRRSWASDPTHRDYLFESILPWQGWPVGELRRAVGDCILDSDARKPEIQRPLTDFILRDTRLGDPRLPANSVNWLSVGDEARRRAIEWLSRADIVFFFDHAFPKHGDKHRRKPFWLQYVSKVEMSRPLLNPEDRVRLRHADVGAGNFGHLAGMSSAFVLDFGAVRVVEFNRVGACYVYPRAVANKVFGDLWAPSEFHEADLKRKDLLPNEEQYRIVHKPGWEDKLRRLLAIHGVRP